MIRIKNFRDKFSTNLGLKWLIRTLAVLFCLVFSATGAGPYEENEGLVQFAIEDEPAGIGWNNETEEFPGYLGNSYYLSTSTSGDELVYNITINNAGNYQILIRSRITGSNNTESNDSWLSMSGDPVPGSWTIETDQNTKFYQNTLGNWTWDTSNKDNDPQAIRQFFSAGSHTLKISPRSEGHAIDHVILFDYESYTMGSETGKRTNLNDIDNFINSQVASIGKISFDNKGHLQNTYLTDIGPVYIFKGNHFNIEGRRLALKSRLNLW